jgi:hypothetical protein
MRSLLAQELAGQIVDEVQPVAAAQTTDLWVPLGSSSGAAGSQCCTFIPVWGHL